MFVFILSQRIVLKVENNGLVKTVYALPPSHVHIQDKLFQDKSTIFFYHKRSIGSSHTWCSRLLLLEMSEGMT